MSFSKKKLLNGITSASIEKRIHLGMRMVTEDPIRDNVIPGFSILEKRR